MTHKFFGPRLDLHAIAWEVANTTDGFISEDLFIELIHADSAGMNCPDCPLFPLPPVSQEHADTYVIYDGIFVLENMEERDAVTLEADIILTLRYKLWHTQIESEKILDAHSLSLSGYTKMLKRRRMDVTEDYVKSIIIHTYLETLAATPIIFGGRLYLSTDARKLQNKILKNERTDRGDNHYFNLTADQYQAFDSFRRTYPNAANMSVTEIKSCLRGRQVHNIAPGEIYTLLHMEFVSLYSVQDLYNEENPVENDILAKELHQLLMSFVSSILDAPHSSDKDKLAVRIWLEYVRANYNGDKKVSRENLKKKYNIKDGHNEIPRLRDHAKLLFLEKLKELGYLD